MILVPLLLLTWKVPLVTRDGVEFSSLFVVFIALMVICLIFDAT